MPISHFSSWDCNWSAKAPDDAETPNQLPPFDAPDDCTEAGSIIGVSGQSLGEQQVLIGSDQVLRYSSLNTPGAGRSFVVGLSGANLPASVESIELRVEIAGHVFEKSYPARTYQTARVNWDGTDAYGRALQGAMTAHVEIGYTYPAVYTSTPRWGSYGADRITGSAARDKVTLWQQLSIALKNFDAKAFGLGGWGLESLHAFDPANKTVFSADGSSRSLKDVVFDGPVADTIGRSVATLQGGGDDPIPAIALQGIREVVYGPDGKLLCVADLAQTGDRLWAIDSSGVARPVTGQKGDPLVVDGAKASEVNFNPPNEDVAAVAVGANGDIFIATRGFFLGQHVWRISNDRVTRVSGGTSARQAGDGGPASKASYHNIADLAVGPDGTVYVLDVGDSGYRPALSDEYNRIRAFKPDGNIRTIAGTLSGPSNVDGVSATQSELLGATAIAADQAGGVYVTAPYRVRRIGTDAIILTVAGGSVANDLGDGGAATSARINAIKGIALDGTGRLYITDDGTYAGFGNRVRMVSTSGIISTVAGSVLTTYSGDGGPAASAGLDEPGSVAVSPSGEIYLADAGYIRRVASGTISRFAGCSLDWASGDGYRWEGLPAKWADISPIDVDYGPDGLLYATVRGQWSRQPSLIRIEADGTCRLLAGKRNGDPVVDAQVDGKMAKDIGIEIGNSAVARDGTIYVSELHRILRISATGVITRIAGEREVGRTDGDGGAAISAHFRTITDIEVAGDGSLWVVDDDAVRRITTDGRIAHVAGGGPSANAVSAGYRGPAAQLYLAFVRDLAVADDGGAYVVDQGNDHQVVRITPGGSVEPAAGMSRNDPRWSSTWAFEEKTRQADLQLTTPWCVAVGADGSLYVGDPGGARIYEVRSDGTCWDAFGNGEKGNGGDGGAPQQASLLDVRKLAVRGAGYVSFVDMRDSWTFRLRTVSLPPSSKDRGYIVPSRDGSEVYLFDRFGLHTATLDPITGADIFRFAYDSKGRVTSITDGDGQATTVERSAGGAPTAIVGPYGHRNTLTLDANGYLTGLTCPLGNTVHFVHTSRGLLTKLTDRRGKSSTFTYDASGRLTKDTNAAGGSKTLSGTESESGRQVVVTDCCGRKTVYGTGLLPSGDRETSVTAPTGAVTRSVTRGDRGRAFFYSDGTTIEVTVSPDPRWGMDVPYISEARVVSPGGVVSRTTQDLSVVLTSTTDPLSLNSMSTTVTVDGNTSTTRWDAANKTLVATTAEGRSTKATLDGKGRLSSLWQDGFAPADLSYDEKGRITALTVSGLKTSLSYVTARPTSVTSADGARTSLGYNGADIMTSLTSPRGSTFALGYDSAGELTDITMPSGAIHRMAYGPTGLQSSYTPPDGAAYVTTRNGEGDITRVGLPTGGSIGYTYDAFGRQTGTSDGTATASVSYVSGLTVPATLSWRSAEGSQLLSITRDGEMVRQLTASGAASYEYKYRYTDQGALAGISLDGGAETVVSQDRDGALTSFGPFTIERQGPSGAASAYKDADSISSLSYDGFGRETTRSLAVSGSVKYRSVTTYDSAGRIARREERTGADDHTYDYSWDGDGQLTGVRKDGGASESFAYDVNGNRVGHKLGSGTTETIAFDSQDRVRSRGAEIYGFDADGFMTRRGDMRLTYARTGELLKATLGNGKTVRYVYDANGRRAARSDDAGTEQYFYGDPTDALRVTASRSAAGVLTEYFYDSADRLIAMRRGSEMLHIGCDGVGSPLVVANDAGTVVKSRVYGAFGDLLSDSAPTFDLPIGFAGGIADPSTGLVRFGYRDYDPASGCWTARDPMRFSGGRFNLYQYCGNDPLRRRDPSGLCYRPVEAHQQSAEYLNTAASFLSDSSQDYAPIVTEAIPGAAMIGSRAIGAASASAAGAAAATAFEAAAFAANIPLVSWAVASEALGTHKIGDWYDRNYQFAFDTADLVWSLWTDCPEDYNKKQDTFGEQWGDCG